MSRYVYSTRKAIHVPIIRTRYSKYEFAHEKRFTAWLKEAQPRLATGVWSRCRFGTVPDPSGPCSAPIRKGVGMRCGGVR